MHGTLASPARAVASATLARAPLRSADDLRRAVLAVRGLPHGRESGGLDRVLRLDVTADRVEAQSAVTWSALARYAADEVPGLARFAQDPWLPLTLGQSLAENSPGPDGCPLVSHIEAVALVTPDGMLRRVSRVIDPELFALAIGGRGAVGIPYSVTLRLSSLARSAARGSRIETLDLHPGGDLAPQRLIFYLPPQRAQDFLDEAREHSQAWRIPIARIEVRCTQAESQTRLRWAQREYAAVALHLHATDELGSRVRELQMHRALVGAAIDNEGSFELSPRVNAAREQILRCYPCMTGFLAAWRHYDPDQRLENDWTRRYATVLCRNTVEARWSTRRAERSQPPRVQAT